MLLTAEQLEVKNSDILGAQDIQNLFPGAEIEVKMNTGGLIEMAQYYVIRLAMGAKVQHKPNGHKLLTRLYLGGREYVMYRSDYEVFELLYKDFCQSFLERRGYPVDVFDRAFSPPLLIEAMRFIYARAKESLHLPLDKIKVFWMIPDKNASGHYRSELPRNWLRSLPDFYVETGMYFSYSQLALFDIVVFHRCPTQATLEMLHRLKEEGKVIVFDTDDDLFAVPEWNPNKDRISKQMLERAATGAAISDVAIVSTEHLRSKLPEHLIGIAAPNLMRLEDFGEPLTEQLEAINFQPQYKGYRPVIYKGKRQIVRPDNKKTGGIELLDRSKIDDKTYTPITILWHGSQTHDEDLNILVGPITRLIEEFGITIRFIFFGSIPHAFGAMEVSSGNQNAMLTTREDLRWCVNYIPPCEITEFYTILRAIKPSIGLCPLSDCEFNLSKSNIKPLELGALGVPCVVSDYGPYRFVTDGYNGLIATTEDDWYSKIKQLIVDDKLRKQLGRDMRRTVEEDFSWNSDSNGLENWKCFVDAIRSKAKERKAALNDLVLPHQQFIAP